MNNKLINTKWFLYLTEFFAGMSVMAVELGASRLMAPYFSSSQIVWTVIITTIISPPNSKAVMFFPISPSPPSGMIFSLDIIFSLISPICQEFTAAEFIEPPALYVYAPV